MAHTVNYITAPTASLPAPMASSQDTTYISYRWSRKFDDLVEAGSDSTTGETHRFIPGLLLDFLRPLKWQMDGCFSIHSRRI